MRPDSEIHEELIKLVSLRYTHRYSYIYITYLVVMEEEETLNIVLF